MKVRDYIIEIVILLLLIIGTYYAMIQKRNIAKEVCDISSYEAYINTKPWCDLLDWNEVKIPEN